MDIGQLIVQLFVIVIVIGGLYSLWKTTQTYGGVVGKGLKWIGAGLLVFSIEGLDQVLGNLSFVSSLAAENADVVHSLLLALGLLLTAIGFSQLSRIKDS